MAYVEGLPRVSHIVSSVFPFEGEGKKRFEKWLKSKGIEIEHYMNIANSYGTAIHKGMEDHINGEFFAQEQYEPEVTKYVSYGKLFLKEERVIPIKTEHYILVEDMYQGTIDLIGEIDGEQWVLDWKTWGIAQEILKTKGPMWKYKKPYDKLTKTTLQLSLYALPLGIKNIGVVELAEHGYIFHKLKIMTQEEITTIVNNYHIGTTTKNVLSVEAKK